jgi:hypothetical protein
LKILLITTLALLNLVAFAQTLELSFDEPKLLTLQPKGSVVGIDNVVVDARNTEFTEPIQVTIERINNPEVLPPFSYSLPVAITNYYLITSPKRHFIQPGQLGVYIPHPEGAPTEILSAGFLRLNSNNDGEAQWALLPATYSPTTDEVLFGLKLVDSKGVIVVIVKGGYYIPK